MIDELLRRTHLCAPSDLAAVIADPPRRIGARSVVLYLIDYEQQSLVPLPGSGRGDLAPLSVAGTIAGRAFSTTSVLRSSGSEGIGQRLWLPLLDGTERLGAIEMTFDAPVSERDYEYLWPCGQSGVYVPVYDRTNRKLKMYSPTTAQATGLTETSTTDLSAQIVYFGAIRPK